MRVKIKPERLVPLLFVACAILVFRDVLASGGALVPGAPDTDLAAQFIAWREFGFAQLRAGRLALWNPYLFCGIPFMAGFESALLYPPNWIHLLLPTGLAIDLSIVGHVALTGAATFAWLRARGRSIAAAAAGGFLFMFCGPVYLRVYAGHLPVVCALAWAPVIFYAVDKRRRGLGAVAVAMQVLAGNPQYAYFTALAVAGYAALRGEKRGAAWMYAGGLLLSAAQWLPGLQAMSESVRAQASYEFASRFALPPKSLLSFVGLDRGAPLFWETSLAFGAAGCLLAAAGAWRPRKEDRPLLWLGAGALLLALGPATPVYPFAYWTVPGLSALRGVGKFAFVLCLCLSALAATGVDRLAEKARAKLPWAAWALCALVLAECLRFAGAGRASCPVEYRYPRQWADALAKLGPEDRALHAFTRFPNAGLVLKRGDLWGYSALVPRRYAELMAAAQGLPWRQATQYLEWNKDSPRVLDLLRCGLVFPPLPGGPVAPRGSPMARAQLVWSWRVASGADAALRSLTAPDFDPRSRVVLEEDPGLGRPPLVGGRVPKVDYSSDDDGVGMTVSVDTPRPAILLVTDSYARGWRATALSGSAQPVYRVLPADHALIGVPLGPGSHHLRLDYRPALATAGAWISLLASAGGLIFLLI